MAAAESAKKRHKSEESSYKSEESSPSTSLRVLFAGEAGSFTQLAALKYFAAEGKTFTGLPQPSFAAVFNGVERGDGDRKVDRRLQQGLESSM